MQIYYTFFLEGHYFLDIQYAIRIESPFRILKTNPDGLYSVVKNGTVVKRKRTPSNANYQVGLEFKSLPVNLRILHANLRYGVKYYEASFFKYRNFNRTP